MAKAHERANVTQTKTRLAQAPEPGPGRLKHLGGSQFDEFNGVLANQAVNTLWLSDNEAKRDTQLDATLAGLTGIAPRNELEGMMAAQLLAAHNAAMECYCRAMIPEQTFEGRRENLAQANKLSRTYVMLVEALNRHRGKGQQKVTVEHVHVHAGGQAVVGHVEHAGGGGREKAEEQPHAISYAPGTPVWSQDEERDPVPVTRDGERAVPHARGHLARRT